MPIPPSTKQAVIARLVLGTAGALWWLAGGVLPAAERVDYLLAIKPLLAARCYACHGALQQKNGLRLDTVELMKKGGDEGPAVVPGDSAASPLLEHITGAGGVRRMPPRDAGEPLRREEAALIQAWIDQGAGGPAGERPEADPRDHWAFKTPVRPPVPAVKDPAWVRNPVDAFIAAERDRRGLTPQPPADRQVLLRRVYLDLVGLPPTRQEMATFLADRSPDAYEKVVERLLASKQYGERWGRHWMDVWRYSDWWGLGAEVRNSQKHIWHWRDWIVESLNADKGYDQMLREMLAADELYPNDLDRLRATGYLARSYFLFNRNTWLDEVVEHTSKGFLGLTLNCARCHDHKFDPIAQQDYYRMRAFFEPYQVRTDMVPWESDLEKDGIPRAFDCNLDATTYLFVRGDEKRPRTDHPIRPGLPQVLSLGELDVRPVPLPPEGHAPGLRPFVLEALLRPLQNRVAAARAGLQQAQKTRDEAERSSKGTTGMTVPPDVHLAVALAEKVLAAALAQSAALKARSAADRARYTQPGAPAARALARQAFRAERQAALAAAEEAVARAELERGRAGADRKAEADKNLAAARAVLNGARQALAVQGEDYTPLPGSIKTPESNVETAASRNRPAPATSSGRRSALARWLTDARNPLTARVAVNHIWARHFGQPLVPTVFDFGRKGTPPTHPALLDWLAVELMDPSPCPLPSGARVNLWLPLPAGERAPLLLPLPAGERAPLLLPLPAGERAGVRGWSLKHLHRLLVTSNAYRMTSSSAEGGIRNAKSTSRSLDPENRYYWRMNPVRMQAEVVRDSLLYLAGDLDLTVGGPPVPINEETSRRRSLYFVHSHNDRQKFLSTFDDAGVLECYRRAESIVPQQALALENSRLALHSAEKIAQRLSAAPGGTPDDEFIRGAFETVLGCRPTSEEQAECARALREWQDLAGGGQRESGRLRARANLVLALLNHNDFVTVR